MHTVPMIRQPATDVSPRTGVQQLQLQAQHQGAHLCLHGGSRGPTRKLSHTRAGYMHWSHCQPETFKTRTSACAPHTGHTHCRSTSHTQCAAHPRWRPFLVACTPRGLLPVACVEGQYQRQTLFFLFPAGLAKHGLCSQCAPRPTSSAAPDYLIGAQIKNVVLKAVAVRTAGS